jgi:hypothetical protein
MDNAHKTSDSKPSLNTFICNEYLTLSIIKGPNFIVISGNKEYKYGLLLTNIHTKQV